MLNAEALRGLDISAGTQSPALVQGWARVRHEERGPR